MTHVRRFVFVVAALLALVSAAGGQAQKSSDIAVVTNPATPVNELSLADVRKVFLGERQYWNSNIPVIVLVRAPIAREREVVLKTIYQMTESQFKQYWVAKIFRSEAVSAPKIVYSADMTNQLLAVIPGSIAFMEAKAVAPGLRVLKVDGRLPGEPGYKLH
jgi:ABC-type phosphate transport system substrate-binding protein